jgi:hypothetical protein
MVISGGGSAASDLPQAPNPPRPAAPANTAFVRNRRRLWKGRATCFKSFESACRTRVARRVNTCDHVLNAKAKSA